MDTLWTVLKYPATWGFLIGLALTFFTWKSGLTLRNSIRKENKRLEKEAQDLQSHLNTQLKINASGNELIQQELKEVKDQNEKLRVYQSILEQKPGRAEMKQLQIMEHAVRVMREQAPGFAGAWENALRQAESDQDAAESGLKKFVRKVIPGISTTVPTPSTENKLLSDSDH